ncbi:MAG TPA: prolyl oligopeptidase family serine peptidase, partial [Gemmatimonadales bacterium]
MTLRRLAATTLVVLACAGTLQAQRPVEVDDLLRLRVVSDPQLSPDGEWVAYTVGAADTVRDRRDRDVWLSSWDGQRHLRLTTSPEPEHTPRWSPDGRRLAFLSARQDPREVDQVWVIQREGGEAERVTDFPGGVSDLAWAPDGTRLALIVSDPDSSAAPAGADSSKPRPRPIVVDRFRFKADETGYLTTRRDHLYVFDLAARRAELITPGEYDEAAPAWSPDGRSIAFVSRRRAEFDRDDNYDLYVVDAAAGASPRQVTTFEGADMNPEWGSRAPSWSPDGSTLAYVQGGRPELIYYAGQKLAMVPVAGGTARLLTASLDRNVLSPTWSPDGRSLYFLLEDDRVYHLARVGVGGGVGVERLVGGRRAITDLTLAAGGRMAVVASSPVQPDEIFAVEGGELRRISTQNDAWLAQVRLAPTEEITVRSRDGTRIHGFMVKPPDYQPGRRYPAVLRIHGGPVWQYFHDFANLDWQVLAANGYVVLGVNPRGSSGRGEKFSTAIWAAWGQKDGEDVLAAVDWAVARGIADPDRLGVGG